MGLFVTYLAYRHGKKKGQRRAARSEAWDSDSNYESDDECQDCGYLSSQHDDEGQCPSYD